MPVCSVLGCSSRTTKGSKGITFHRFPKDSRRRKQWIYAIQRDEENWKPTMHSTVCSNHFSTQQFDSSAERIVRLKDSAVPCLFSKVDLDNDRSRISITETGDGSHSPYIVLVDSLRNLEKHDEESEIKIETILPTDLPKEALLKAKLQKSKSRNAELTKKIATLQRTKQRKSLMIAMLKNCIIELLKKEHAQRRGVET